MQRAGPEGREGAVNVTRRADVVLDVGWNLTKLPAREKQHDFG